MSEGIEMWVARDDISGKKTNTFLFQNKPDMIRLRSYRVTYLNRTGWFVRVDQFLQIKPGKCLPVKLIVDSKEAS